MKRCLFLCVGSLLAFNGAWAADSPRQEHGITPMMRPSLPLHRLSSGALSLLDQNGDLVAPPAAPLPAWLRPAAVTESVTLDLRVGRNIAIGSDPPQLPANQRAQAEPHIIRSTTDPDFLVGTFQEGRFAVNGGALDCGYGISHDGGLTWTRSLIPGLTRSLGGTYFRATDPVAALDLNGNIILNTLTAINSNFSTGAVVVSRSTDGGQTFLPPVEIFRQTSGVFVPDKDWIVANTFPGTPHAGRLFATFTLFNSNTNESPIVGSFSDNGGATWSPVTLTQPGNTFAQGSQPVFLHDGTLAMIYWNFGSATQSDERLEVIVSSDGGASFGPPVRIASAVESIEPSIRSGAFLPSATTDRTTSSIYVVYTTLASDGPHVMFTKSSNAGATWTTPVGISDGPPNNGVFNAAIAASPDGQTLTVSFYDRRVNLPSTTLVDLFMAQSLDGGLTWQPNIRLTSVSSDATLAPLTNEGYMLGDYLAIAPSTTPDVPAVPIWVDTRTSNPDPFVTRVGIASQVDFTSWQAARLSLAEINNPLLGGQAGDADGDHEDNLSEFLSGTDPNDPSSVVRTGRPVNLSTRLPTQTGQNVLIGGFIISGSVPKTVIVRAIGPSLTALQVPGALPDPTLELHDANGVIAFNDNWRDTQEAAIIASGHAPSNDLESAILVTLAPGAYTAIVQGAGNTTGNALVELYDLDPTAPVQLVNISTRGFVGTVNDVMIAGFIIGSGLGVNGDGSVNVVVRAIGPSLAQQNVTGTLQNPNLALYDQNGTQFAFNENWKDTQQAAIQATGRAPSDDREAAILVALPAGAYTAIVRGNGGTTGVALVEVFVVP